MKHKPVAWRFNDCSDYQYVCDERMLKMIDKDTKLTPLYEHPKQTLNKKKIKEILTEMYGDDWSEEDITFAIAILRKAQEK